MFITMSFRYLLIILRSFSKRDAALWPASGTTSAHLQQCPSFLVRSGVMETGI